MTFTAVQVVAAPGEEVEPEIGDGAPVELAIAFTDLVDFTTYTETEGDGAASRLLISHHRQASAIVRSRGGRVIKRLGDGLLLAFSAPEAAVLACMEIGESSALPLRCGLHVGAVVVAGGDVIGRVVNLAARVAASAEGGQLMVTEQVRTAVGDLRGVAFDGPQRRAFKGINEQVAVYLASRPGASAGSTDGEQR